LQVEVLELGGEGRDVLSSDRNRASEGGQLTVGWATPAFRGDAFGHRGVGDDRHSWGLRAGDPRTFSQMTFDEDVAADAAASGQTRGPCFVFRGVPTPWRPGGKAAPQTPFESGRALASGDVIGCSIDTATGETNFAVMRRVKMFEAFEIESSINSQLRYENFALTKTAEVG